MSYGAANADVVRNKEVVPRNARGCFYLSVVLPLSCERYPGITERPEQTTPFLRIWNMLTAIWAQGKTRAPACEHVDARGYEGDRPQKGPNWNGLVTPLTGL